MGYPLQSKESHHMADTATNKPMDAPPSAAKRTINRGPNFPAISLPKAIERAQGLYDIEKRNAVPAEVALRHWGYTNPKSSSATMTMAALRSYGLLDYVGSGKTLQVKLSPRALKVLLKTPERDAEIK